MRHTVAWLLWVCSAASLALTLRNPLYTTLIVLAAWLVHLSVGSGAPLAGGWRALLRLGLVIWLITIPFNALMNHAGSHVLFALPAGWPLIGGAVTLEAVLSGLVSGYALWVLLLVFSTFNMATDVTELVRSVPPFLFQAGVIATIALTFLPQMLQSAREIREAQRIRGHRFRGWRDALPLLMPLLTTAFERAVQLAESMESRGLGGQTVAATLTKMARMRAAMAAALLGLLCGLVVRVVWLRLAGDLLIAVSALLLIVSFWEMGRHVRRTRYARQRWSRADTAGAVAGLIALGAGLFVARVFPALVAYDPYAGSLLPPFSVWLGLALMLLALPAMSPAGDAGSDALGIPHSPGEAP